MSGFTNLGAALTASPDAIAIIDLSETKPREVTYGELDQLSAAVARGLRRAGVGRGDAVAIVSGNRFEFLAVLFAALRIGAKAVPVNHKLPAQTVAFILNNSKVRLMFCDEARAPLCPPDVAKILFDGAGEGSFSAFCDPGAFEPVVPQPGEAAMVMYTSGTTGQPKGVLFEHVGHLWALNVRARLAVPGQRVIVAAPLYHQNGLNWCQVTLAAGGSVVLMPRFDARAFIKAVAHYSIRMVTAVPTMLALVAREKETVATLDLSCVSTVRVGSAPSTPALLAQIHELFPQATAFNGFATTEGGPVCFGAHPQGLSQSPISVGYPHPDVSVRLIREGEAVEDQGVLQIKSPAVMLGYQNRPDLTAKVMTADGYYITGDVFRKDENGFYYFVRRDDDMFVCGGENIFPGEVETMLMAHPDVDHVCVVPVDDEIKGKKPVAFIVSKANRAPTEGEIKSYALANGPPYQHPRHVWFLTELPLASTNKIDRQALIARAESRLRHELTQQERQGAS